MSESVEILIKAEDLATPVVNKAGKAVDSLDASLKKVKESGSQAKKSADFARIIASSLGGSEIGSYIGQIGEAADKTAQFAEVQKLGGAGSMLFKAGLVGLVATIALGIGNAIGNAIFQTERWKKAMTDATAEAARLESQLIAVKAIRFSDIKTDIELIRDPEGKKAAYADLFKATNKEIVGVERRINETKKAVDAYNASYTPSWIQGSNAAAEQRLKTDMEGLEVLKKQREETRAETLERQAAIKEIEKQTALQDKSDDYVENLRSELELLRATKEEQAGILAVRNAIGEAAQEEAKQLLIEKEAIAVAQEATKQSESLVAKSGEYVANLRKEVELLKLSGEERDAMQAKQDTVGGDTAVAAALISEKNLLLANREIEKKAIADRESESKRIAGLKESELQKLEEERILLTQGKEAAAAFALEKQGLSKGDAFKIAREKSTNEAMKQKVKADDTQLAATESRLLSRGKTDNFGASTAANTATLVQQNTALQQQVKFMNAHLQKIANKQEPEFAEVS